MPLLALITIQSITGCGTTKQVGDASNDAPGDEAPVDATLDDAESDVAPDTCVIPDRDRCTTDEDCDGRRCIRFPDEPGGIRYCEPRPAEEATGPTGDYCDQCSSSEDCTGPNAACFTTPWPCFDDCGAPPDEHNICVQDECTADGDCQNMCLPPEISKWRRSQCVSGSCRLDGDCTAEPCGYCTPLYNPCCSYGRMQGYFCVYPGSCAHDGDCEGGRSCIGDPATGRTYCDWMPCPD